jgi:hypothetical protein
MIAQTRRMLTQKTATVSFASVERAGELLQATVQVQVATGHKFPSGYPSRRAWLALEVRDASDQIVFRSGAWDDRGRLVSDGTVLPHEVAGGPIHPHRTEVTAPDQVVVYESVMADGGGTPVYRLLRAQQYAKDNRLLPPGWSETHPDMDRIAPVGVDGDLDFGPGGDRIVYAIPAPEAAGPYTLYVSLVYQSLSPRFVDELLQVDAPIVQSFGDMWAASDPRPEAVAEASVSAP